MLYALIIIAIVIGMIIIARWPRKGDIYEVEDHYFKYLKVSKIDKKKVCGYWLDGDNNAEYYCGPLIDFLLVFKKKYK